MTMSVEKNRRSSWVVGFVIATPLLAILLCARAGMSADYPPADHGGADLVLADGDRVWGLHENIGTLSIPTSATVHVLPFDGTTTDSTGWFEARCARVDIAGTLDASGAGFTGGGGGGGGGGYLSPGGDWHFPPTSFRAGLGGTPAYPSTACGGQPGIAAGWHLVYFPIKSWAQDTVSAGGAGAPGDGPAAGAGGGQPGEYALGGTDTSVDTAVWFGSGGGGGSGSAGGFASPGPGGGGGGCGGGAIRLTATSSFALRTGAALLTQGWLGGNGSAGTADSIMGPISGDGGNALLPQGGLGGNASAGNGGAGAGGGILLDLHTAGTIRFEPGSLISTADGTSTTARAGTLKLVHPDSTAPDLSGVTITAGRLFQTSPAAVRNWSEYD